MSYLRKLIRDDNGYGIVELLIIVACLGLFSSKTFRNLTDKVVGDGTNDDSSTVGQVTNGINDIIGNWIVED